MIWPDSPFQVGADIRNDRFFYDRQPEIQELRRLIGSPHINIHLVEGPRRIGKSSLLQKCLREFGVTHVVALLDFSKVLFNRIEK